MLKEKNQLFYLKLVKKFYDKYKVNNYYPHFDTPIYLASYLMTINSNLIKKVLNYNYFKIFIATKGFLFYPLHFIYKKMKYKFLTIK